MKKKKGFKDALDFTGELAQKCGGMSSDCDFPRTKFGSSVLSVTKKEGSNFFRMLLGLLIASLSDCGREILLMEHGMEPNCIEDEVHMIELIISMEEWLKHSHPTRCQLAVLPAVIKDFISKVNFNSQRGGWA